MRTREETGARKASLSIAWIAAVMFVVFVIAMITGGFLFGTIELALLAAIIAIGLVWIWR